MDTVDEHLPAVTLHHFVPPTAFPSVSDEPYHLFRTSAFSVTVAWVSQDGLAAVW